MSGLLTAALATLLLAGGSGTAFATAPPTPPTPPAPVSPPSVSDVPQHMPTFNGGIYASVYVGNTIYVGGAFTRVNWSGRRWIRNGLAAINVTTGALLAWAPSADAAVRALAADPITHVIYAGGDFAHINAAPRHHLAAINATTAIPEQFAPYVAGQPLALAVGHGRLYMGGRIVAVDDQPRRNLAAFNLPSGTLNTRWLPTADDIVHTIVSTPDRIYIGGRFMKLDGVPGRMKIGTVSPVDGQLQSVFEPHVSVMVYAISIGPDGIYVAEGGHGGRAVAYTPDGADEWTVTTDGDVQAIALLSGIVYLGGHFDNVCTTSRITSLHGNCVDGSIPRGKLAAANAATGALGRWNPDGNGVHGVYTVAADETQDTVAAGGEFTTLNGAFHGRFGQFTSRTSTKPSWSDDLRRRTR